MAWNKAREFEASLFVEALQNFGAVVGADGLAVRVVMLHVRIFFHERRVLEVVSGTREDELMAINPIIPNDKLNLLAAVHLERLRRVPHAPLAVMDTDADDPKWLCRIARFAGRKVLSSMGIELGRRADHAGHQRGRRPQDN